MSVPSDTLCLFHAQVEKRDGSWSIEVPEREVRDGGVSPGQAYRVALLPAASPESSDRGSGRVRSRGGREPPVKEGESVELEIEDIGEQGDGLARIGPGYIVFVSDTDLGDRITAEITQVKENFAFGEVVEGPY